MRYSHVCVRGRNTSNPYHLRRCGYGCGSHDDDDDDDDVPECTECDYKDFDPVGGADPNDMSVL